MKALQVYLDYGSRDTAPPPGARQTPLALPLRVLDADGSLITDGVASTSTPARFDVSSLSGPVFVRLTWPSGKTQTQRVEVDGRSLFEVSFSDVGESEGEGEGAAAAGGMPRSRAIPGQASIPPADKFERVWLLLWTFQAGSWQPSKLEARQSYNPESGRQFDVELDAKCQLLQLGGRHEPWRFVALPGGGACRVLIKPNESTDPRAERLKVIVTSFRRDAESLLEFLARDSLRAAHAVASYQPLAQQLLEGKADDPVSAVAAAYFLLRTGRWQATPLSWFDSLASLSPWIADGLIIRCVLMTRLGLAAGPDTEQALAMLQASMNRGLPIFSEGMALLHEAASVLRSASGSGKQGVFEQIERLVASQAWAGAALSFYGVTPDMPSPERVVGLPGRSRLRSNKASGSRGASESLHAVDAAMFTFLGDMG
jgi:hypothetical protein